MARRHRVIEELRRPLLLAVPGDRYQSMLRMVRVDRHQRTRWKATLKSGAIACPTGLLGRSSAFLAKGYAGACCASPRTGVGRTQVSRECGRIWWETARSS